MCVCLSPLPLAHPVSTCARGLAWPLSAHVPTGVLAKQGGSVSSLFLFKPTQFDSSWTAALSQEWGRAALEGEGTCGHFLPQGWGETVDVGGPLQWWLLL